MLDGGKDMLCFVMAHIGFHVVPVGSTVRCGREGEYLFGETLRIAFVAEVVFATNAVGNSCDIGSVIAVEAGVVSNCHIGCGNKVFGLVNGIAHRPLAIADKSDTIAMLNHRGVRCDEIEDSIVEIGCSKVADAMGIRLEVIEPLRLSRNKCWKNVPKQKILVGHFVR